MNYTMGLSAKPLGSHPAPATFKLVFHGEIRRVAAPSSWGDLQATCSSFWGEHAFWFTYTDEEGDTVAIGSAPEFAEAHAVARALGKSVFKLHAYPSHEALRAALLPPPLSASGPTAAEAEAEAVHWGVVCDRSNMSPIVGPRYHVLGNNYDLCQAEFNLLPESERVLYVKISHPGAHPEPCLPADVAAADDNDNAQPKAASAEAKAPPEPAPVASAVGAAAVEAAAPKPKEQGLAAPPAPPASSVLAASWVQLASEPEEPAKPNAPTGATAVAGTASAEEAEANAAAAAAAAAIENAAEIEGEIAGAFAGEVAELRLLGLVGEGPGGAAAAVRALQQHQGRLDATVNALLDGR